MNEHNYNELTEEISGTYSPYQISCNKRLRSSGGRYLPDEISRLIHLMEQNLGLEALIGVVGRLCHYHLHQTGGGYRHRDQDSNAWLHQVGGSRYDERMERAVSFYECTTCHHPLP